ncbi:hypothetical protein V8D89_000723 [Ganoderma adspersum]
MWRKILSLVQLVVKSCLDYLFGDPVTIRFFLARATRTFGPHEVFDRGDFKLALDKLNLASIREWIVRNIVNKKFPNEFPNYSDLRIFLVTTEDGFPERFSERLPRKDAVLLTDAFPQNFPSSTVYIAAIYDKVCLSEDRPERKRNILRATWAPSPSELGKNLRAALDDHLVLIGPPLDVTAPDPSIFSPLAASLFEALNDPHLEPEGSISDTITELFSVSAVTYDTEDERFETVRPIVEKLFQVELEPQWAVSFKSECLPVARKRFKRQRLDTPPGARADGVVVTALRPGSDACPAIFEVKNELGMAGAGDFQVAATHMKFMVHPKVRPVSDKHLFIFLMIVFQFAYIRERTSCPAILFSISGAAVHIAYGILADAFMAKPIGQHWFPLGGATAEQRRTNLQNLARVVPAVRNAIRDLHDFYTALPSTPAEGLPHPYLPNPTLSNSQASWFHQLVFRDKLTRDASQTLFRARLHDEDVIVKFCDGYGEEAHRRLAEHNLAPVLRHKVRLVGGLTMVVMGFQPRTMMSAYDKYFGRALPKCVVDEVGRALGFLHAEVQETDGHEEKKLVHGDITRSNILVSRDADQDTSVQLVGFRWSGVAGSALYPCDVVLNELTVQERTGNGRMMMEHDTSMLARLSETGAYY